ncbi:MAG TPA: ring-cleaving dioxygenase [Acidobacteriota bacterium]|jgi:catechol 2,3-dioxygenase-like lactoylglutathione lyase family enzyme
MSRQVLGIHHITAIAGEPQANIDFYAGMLGLRLVKLTVNFDDPGSYHLYYGDESGSPGTILTFFPWPGAFPGRAGTGQVTVISFSIPPDAMGYWMERLKSRSIEFTGPGKRFDEELLAFRDPDGLQLELVAHQPQEGQKPWVDGPVPERYALGGFYAATIAEEGYERTAGLITATLGFRSSRESGNRFRYEVGNGGPGRFVDLLCTPDDRRGVVAGGTVHHIAWRTPNDKEQQAWRDQLARLAYNVTPILDRKYFRSIYFREPGGVLFEIATDPPGFTVDEPPKELGTRLMLPDWLESSRDEILRALPPVRLTIRPEIADK